MGGVCCTQSEVIRPGLLSIEHKKTNTVTLKWKLYNSNGTQINDKKYNDKEIRVYWWNSSKFHRGSMQEQIFAIKNYNDDSNEIDIDIKDETGTLNFILYYFESKESQRLPPESNVQEIKIKIPPKKLCLTFKHGEYLEFIDNKIARKNGENSRWSTFVFGEEIFDTELQLIYNKFEIHFKVNADSITMGFLKTAPSECSINWNEKLGANENRFDSVGISHTKEFLTTGRISYVFYEEYNGRRTSVEEFVLSFDFKEKEMKIYHLFDKESDDDRVAVSRRNRGWDPKTVSFENCERVIPAFSLYNKGDQIEILKWEFDDGKGSYFPDKPFPVRHFPPLFN
eukprot:449983_1